MVLSAWSSTPLEEVAKAAGSSCQLWQNVYLWKDRQKLYEIVKRAEDAQFKAIVVTCDATAFGKRRGYSSSMLRDSVPNIR